MNTFNEFELNKIKKFYTDELANRRLLQRSKSSRLPPGTRHTSQTAAGAGPSSSLGARSPRSVSSSAGSSVASVSPVAIASGCRPIGRQMLARSADRLQSPVGVDLNRYQRAFLSKRAPSAGSMRAGSNLQQLRKSMARFGRTLFDFQAKNERELSLKRGDLVEMLELIDHNWARVEDCQSGLQGLVPLSYIDYSVGCAVAKRDVTGQQQVSGSCPREAPLLPMSKGEPITLIRRLSGHWYEASNTRQANGLVWSNDLDIIKQPVLVAAAGSQRSDHFTDDHDQVEDDDEEMLILDTGERVLASRAAPNRRAAAAAAAVAGETNRVAVAAECQSCACNPTNTTTIGHSRPQPMTCGSRTLQSCASQRQELLARQPRRSSSSPYISSGSAAAADANQQQQLPRLCRAKFAYKPRQKDELELVVGDILMVVHECDDGWFVGTSYSSKETGTFPGNFVEPIA